MKVKVKRCSVREKIKDGESSIYTEAVVIFTDGMTAAKLFIPEEVCDPDKIVEAGVYDLYRDEKGYCLVFDLLKLPE